MADRQLGININVEGNSALFREALKQASLGLKDFTKDLGAGDRALIGFTGAVRASRDQLRDLRTQVSAASRATESYTLWVKRARDAMKDEAAAAGRAASALDEKTAATKLAAREQQAFAERVRAMVVPALDEEKRKAVETAKSVDTLGDKSKTAARDQGSLADQTAKANRKMDEQLISSRLATSGLERQTRATNELTRAQERQQREADRQHELNVRRFMSGLAPGGRRAVGAAGFAGAVTSAAAFGGPAAAGLADVGALIPAVTSAGQQLLGVLPALGPAALGAGQGFIVMRDALEGVNKVVAADTPAQLRTAMRALDPQTQKVAMTFRNDLRPALESVQAIGRALDPTLFKLGDTFAKLLSKGAIHDGLVAAEKSLVKIGDAINKVFSNPDFQKTLDHLLTGAGKGLGNLANMLPPLIDGMVRLFNDALPLANGLAKIVTGWLDNWDIWMKNHPREVHAFFKDTLDIVQGIGSTIGNFLNLMNGLDTAARPFSEALGNALKNGLGQLANLVNSPQGQSALRNFFAQALPTLGSFAHLLGGLLKAIGELAAMPSTQEVLRGLFDGLRQYVLPFLKDIADTVPGILTQLGPVFKEVGDFALSVLKPLVDALLNLVRVALPPLASLIKGIADTLKLPLQELTGIVQLLTKVLGLVGGIGGGGGGIAEIGLLAALGVGGKKLGPDLIAALTGGLYRPGGVGGSSRAVRRGVVGSIGNEAIRLDPAIAAAVLGGDAVAGARRVSEARKLEQELLGRPGRIGTTSADARAAMTLADRSLIGDSAQAFSIYGLTKSFGFGNVAKATAAESGVLTKIAKFTEAMPKAIKAFGVLELGMAAFDGLNTALSTGSFSKGLKKAGGSIIDPITHGSLLSAAASGAGYGALAAQVIPIPGVNALAGAVVGAIGGAVTHILSQTPKDVVGPALHGLVATQASYATNYDIRGLNAYTQGLRQQKRSFLANDTRSGDTLPANISAEIIGFDTGKLTAIRQALIGTFGAEMVRRMGDFSASVNKNLVGSFQDALNTTGSVIDSLNTNLQQKIAAIQRDFGSLKTGDGLKMAHLAIVGFANATGTAIANMQTSVEVGVHNMLGQLKALHAGPKMTGEAFDTMRAAIQDAMTKGVISVQQGAHDMAVLTDAMLKALGATPAMAKAIKGAQSHLANTSLTPSSSAASSGNPFQSPFRAVGGYIGQPGAAGGDNIPIVVGEGEAVLNRHQQAPVDTALRMVYGKGLPDLFREVQTPHYMATGGFAGRGGYYFPLTGQYSWNRVDQGQDLQGQPGADVVAITKGTVTKGSDRFSGFGPFYPILHTAIGDFYYGHTKDTVLGPVNAGQVIGVTQSKANTWTAAPAGWLEFGQVPIPPMGGGGGAASLLHSIAATGQALGFKGSGALGAAAALVNTHLKQSKSGLPGAIGKMADAMLGKVHSGLEAVLGNSGGAGGPAPNVKGRWNVQQIAHLWKAAGGPSAIAGLMARIAYYGESGGDPNAYSPSGATGLWQILGALLPGNLRDPMVNAKNAVAKWRQQGLIAWAGDKIFNAEVAGKRPTGPGQYARGGFVGLPHFAKGGTPKQVKSKAKAKHFPKLPKIHFHNPHSFGTFGANSPVPFVSQGLKDLGSLTGMQSAIDLFANGFAPGELGSIRDTNFDGTYIYDPRYAEDAQTIGAWNLAANPQGMIAAWKDTQLIHKDVDLWNAENKAGIALSADQGSLGGAMRHVLGQMMHGLYGGAAYLFGFGNGPGSQMTAYGHPMHPSLIGNASAPMAEGYLQVVKRIADLRRLLVYVQHQRSVAKFQARRKAIADRFTKLRADLQKNSLKKSYSLSQYQRDNRSLLANEKRSMLQAVTDSYMDPVTAGDVKAGIQKQFAFREKQLSDAAASAGLKEQLTKVDMRTLLTLHERADLAAVTADEQGFFFGNKLKQEHIRADIANASSNATSLLKEIRKDAHVVDIGDPSQFPKGIPAILSSIGVSLTRDQSGSVAGQLKDNLSSLSDQMKQLNDETIGGLVRDRDNLLGTTSTGGGSTGDTTLADLQKQIADDALRNLALANQQFSVFSGFAPLLAGRMQGSFYKGGVIPETGYALVHKHERILPDPDGPFGRYSSAGSVGGDTHVELHLHGGLGEMVDRAVMRQADKIVKLTSERQGRRTRLIAAAPGGR